jgi:hypothetical protein
MATPQTSACCFFEYADCDARFLMLFMHKIKWIMKFLDIWNTHIILLDMLRNVFGPWIFNIPKTLDESRAIIRGIKYCGNLVAIYGISASRKTSGDQNILPVTRLALLRLRQYAPSAAFKMI